MTLIRETDIFFERTARELIGSKKIATLYMWKNRGIKICAKVKTSTPSPGLDCQSQIDPF